MRKGLSPTDVVNALTAQNLILPAGDAKVGRPDYIVRTNASPLILDQLNDLPIKSSNGAMVYMRDVAQVHEGFAVQQNIVRINGQRAALLTILKAASASTLDIVKRVKEALPKILADLPPRAEDRPAVRPVDLRAGGAAGRGEGGGDRGGPDGADDPAVPGELAHHADRRGLDSAVDPDVDHHDEGCWARR